MDWMDGEGLVHDEKQNKNEKREKRETEIFQEKELQE